MDNQTLRETSERIDELLDELGQSALPAVMERVEELLRSVMTLYGAGLDRVLEIADRRPRTGSCDGSRTTRSSATCWSCTTCTPTTCSPACRPRSTRCGPTSGRTPAGWSCSASTPSGVAHLQLEGSCDGCASSALTVQERHRGRRSWWPPPTSSRWRPRAWSRPGPGAAADPALPSARRARDPLLGRLAAPRARRVAAHSGPGEPRATPGSPSPTWTAPWWPTSTGAPPAVPRCRAVRSPADVLTCASCGQGYDARRAGRAIDDTGGEPDGPRAAPARARGLEGRRPAGSGRMTGPSSGLGSLRRIAAPKPPPAPQRSAASSARSTSASGTGTSPTSPTTGCSASAGPATSCSRPRARAAAATAASVRRYAGSADLLLDDARWDSLRVPVDLVFFFRQTGRRPPAGVLPRARRGDRVGARPARVGRHQRGQPGARRRSSTTSRRCCCAVTTDALLVLPRADRRLLRAGRAWCAASGPGSAAAPRCGARSTRSSPGSTTGRRRTRSGEQSRGEMSGA